MNYEALGDRVLIKPQPKTEEIAGFQLMDGDQRQDPIGEVILVGDGVPLQNINLKIEGTVDEAILDRLERIVDLIQKGRPIKVKPGDIVNYGQYAGTKVLIEGQEYIMIRECDVFGRIPKKIQD